MRGRDHLIAALGLALINYPDRPLAALMTVAGGVGIDLDHLLLYALRSGDWRIEGAIAYNRYRHLSAVPGDNRPRYGPLRSWVHSPLIGLLALAGAVRWPRWRPLLIGFALHHLLDHWPLPFFWFAEWRAAGHCQRCGGRKKVRGTLLFLADAPHGRIAVLCHACRRLYRSEPFS